VEIAVKKKVPASDLKLREKNLKENLFACVEPTWGGVSFLYQDTGMRVFVLPNAASASAGESYQQCPPLTITDGGG